MKIHRVLIETEDGRRMIFPAMMIRDLSVETRCEDVLFSSSAPFRISGKNEVVIKMELVMTDENVGTYTDEVSNMPEIGSDRMIEA